MATITTEMTRHIIRELLTDGGNHRLAVFQDINRQFLSYALDFLDRARKSKIRWEESQTDAHDNLGWYHAHLDEQTSDREELQIIGGMPSKTLANIYHGGSLDVVRGALHDNVQHLGDTLNELHALGRRGGEAVITYADGFEFTHEESILIINSLAVKRAQISGGNWSSVGMSVESPLLQCLCLLFDVDPRYHRGGVKKDNRYQVDYMLQRSGVEYRCEVKLNGRGNPESVTSAIARDPRILLADWVSKQNEEKLNASAIAWVNFSETLGYRRFGDVLDRYAIPHTTPDDLSRLDDILDRVLPLP